MLSKRRNIALQEKERIRSEQLGGSDTSGINNPVVSYSQICQSTEPCLLFALGGIL